MSGTLYLVATPIGNLEDITLRALRILEEVDYIACEDTRHSIKLLNHFNLKKPLVSYHEHNKYEKGPKLIEDLKNGQNIALVTDAGTPAISDPGEDLVKLAMANGISYTSVPGPVALINALVLSGRDTRRFCFEGFLPYHKKHRVHVLEQLVKEERTTILYESPHKLTKTLNDLFKYVGNRRISIIRELTKKFEEVLELPLEEAINYYSTEQPRGEYVLILEGADPEKLAQEIVEKWAEMSVKDHMAYYGQKGLSQKEAMKAVAKDRKLSKRDIYSMLHKD